MTARLLALLLFVLTSGGCAVAVGVTGPFHVPADSQGQCRNQCAKIGMGLGAVAIMANNVGCVCEPAGAASRPHAAVAAGMATILTQEEARRSQQ